jgi:hypothetical protein
MDQHARDLLQRHSTICRPILVALTIASLAYAYVSGNLAVLQLSIALEGGFAVLYRRRVLEIIGGVREPAAEMSRFYAVLSRVERESVRAPKLRNLKSALEAGRQPAASQARRLSGLAVMVDYRINPNTGLILPLFLWTTQLGFAIEAWRRRYGSRIRQWIEIAGEFDALCAMAGFAYEHPEYTFPEIEDDGPYVEGHELRHPLVPASQCVPNSVRLGGDLRLMIVSGSNMSGKSTFLRTLGINLVLAQAGAPVAAGRLRCSVMMIGASLRTQDSLRAGTSRFYAEVQRLNAILNHAQSGKPVLFLLDEILQGTNSHDRVVGAEAVLRAMLESGAIGVVTTHDLAIAEIAGRLGGRAVNMHFQDRMENGTLVFDYVLHNGVVTRSNAIDLMRAAGLKI